MTPAGLKETARALFMTAVRAADPAGSVRRALLAQPLARHATGRLIIIAIGKASCAMMQEALQHVPAGQNCVAIAVPNYENARDIAGCRVMPAGHPLPDENGLAAGRAVIELLQGATADDRVLCLISGGGSALLPAPRAGLSLADKIAVNQVLLAGGMDITQMNRVRQRLSVLKGGGLLAIAHPAPVRSLIMSDVVGDDLGTIASGPTVPCDPGQDVVAPLKAAGLWQKLPAAAMRALQRPQPMPDGLAAADNALICTNGQSLRAVAQAAPDWAPQIMPDPLVGDVAEAVKRLISDVNAAPHRARQLLIWGGETTVNITGSGRGGRNQELAVRFARLAGQVPGRWVFLSGGTDGRDGPTDAAGGVVDAQTVARAQASHINVEAALLDNDSYRILEAAGDLLITGATGTNVADVQMFLRLGP